MSSQRQEIVESSEKVAAISNPHYAEDMTEFRFCGSKKEWTHLGGGEQPSRTARRASDRVRGDDLERRPDLAEKRVVLASVKSVVRRNASESSSSC